MGGFCFASLVIAEPSVPARACIMQPVQASATLLLQQPKRLRRICLSHAKKILLENT